jgi:hypothetical protein
MCRVRRRIDRADGGPVELCARAIEGCRLCNSDWRSVAKAASRRVLRRCSGAKGSARLPTCRGHCFARHEAADEARMRRAEKVADGTLTTQQLLAGKQDNHYVVSSQQICTGSSGERRIWRRATFLLRQLRPRLAAPFKVNMSRVEILVCWYTVYEGNCCSP